MSEKIRVGVIGVGHLGQHHARNYAENPEAELVYVCDTSGSQAKKIAGAFGAKAAKDYNDLIGKVDAVSIATPTVTHFEIAETMLSNGIHCLVEKPICNTVVEAAKMAVLASTKGLILQVGHIEHFNVAVQKFKEILTTPLFIECHRLGPFNPRVKDIGVVMDLMIHDIDIILRIVNSPIESIEATGVAILTDKEDIANARIRFQSGCIANVTCSRVTPKPMRKLRVFQDNAYISLDYKSQTMQIHRRFRKEGKLDPGEARYFIETEKVRVRRKEPLKLELEHFLQCIRQGRVPQTTGVQAMEALDVVVKITEMIRNTTVPFMNNAPLFPMAERLREESTPVAG
ncbi:Gfo/Idh/MocA family oxidoreductase [Candidatus Poribacteria bacterium]|nr:Gfo/Idh/MocA family oxidoreductase [Candidatus Poribacteria bacterium]